MDFFSVLASSPSSSPTCFMRRPHERSIVASIELRRRVETPVAPPVLEGQGRTRHSQARSAFTCPRSRGVAREPFVGIRLSISFRLGRDRELLSPDPSHTFFRKDKLDLACCVAYRTPRRRVGRTRSLRCFASSHLPLRHRENCFTIFGFALQCSLPGNLYSRQPTRGRVAMLASFVCFLSRSTPENSTQDDPSENPCQLL